MLEDDILDDYAVLDETLVNVGNGVRGDKNFGDDSPQIISTFMTINGNIGLIICLIFDLPIGNAD